MDNLLEALKTGSAFAVGREGKGRKRTPRAAGGKHQWRQRIFICDRCDRHLLFPLIARPFNKAVCARDKPVICSFLKTIFR